MKRLENKFKKKKKRKEKIVSGFNKRRRKMGKTMCK